MKNLLLPLSLALILSAACSQTTGTIPTDRPCADLETGTEMFGRWADNPGAIPGAGDYCCT